MPSRLNRLAEELSLDDLKRLLKVKEEMTVLEKRRAVLAKELADVDSKLSRLRDTVKPAGRKGRQSARRGAKSVVAPRKGTVAGVVEELIRATGRAMSFPEIHDAVVKGKLVTTKSKNFANVLRRTLSTSEAFVRVSRGVYGVRGVTAVAPKKATAKTSTRKKAAKKRVGKKATAKKTSAKKAATKRSTPAKKTAKKAARKKAETKKKTAKSAAGRSGTLEDVVVSLLRKEGGPLSFQTLLKTIVDGKLFRSKAKDFANVLRRTLSTSKRVKRKGRGIYGL